MKHNIIQFKKFTIDICIQKVYNGFEFAPIRIYKFKLIDRNYISIETVLIKYILFIDFIWNRQK